MEIKMSDKELEIDLTVMPSGTRYEDRYGQYLEIFHRIATTPANIKVVVVSPPASWWPLFMYLQCWIRGKAPQIYFEHCKLVKDATYTVGKLDRTAVEVLCGFRPECVDALWKIDMQWEVPEGRVRKENKKEFIVTNNGSFHRPEVTHYLKNVLAKYTPKKRKVVLVPCAADKPYPSRLHKEVLARMPDDYYLAVATGVLGIVPQDLWPEMPHYDSGIPNEWRLMRIAEKYFHLHQHNRVVVYCDYYSEALEQAFENINGGHILSVPYGLEKVKFVLPIKFYYDYENLLSENWLKLLEQAFQNERVEEIA
jgi:hypothetical protein